MLHFIGTHNFRNLPAYSFVGELREFLLGIQATRGDVAAGLWAAAILPIRAAKRRIVELDAQSVVKPAVHLLKLHSEADGLDAEFAQRVAFGVERVFAAEGHVAAAELAEGDHLGRAICGDDHLEENEQFGIVWLH